MTRAVGRRSGQAWLAAPPLLVRDGTRTGGQRTPPTADPGVPGAELVGEVAHYEDDYRRCFLHGPEGIMIGLAEQLS